MKERRKYIAVTIVVVMIICAFFVWKISSKKLINEIIPKDAKTVGIEKMPDSIEINDRIVIKDLINKLRIDEWVVKNKWDLSFAPNFFISFKPDEYIGLFGSGEKYAKVVTEKSVQYYIIPSQIYDDIKLIYDANKPPVVKETSVKDKDDIISEMLKLPNKYDSETAIKNGDIVIALGQIHNKDRFDEFLKLHKEGKKDKIRIVAYTIEGDAIIKVVSFDGNKIYVHNDNTRDEYSVEKDRVIRKHVGNKLIVKDDEVKYSQENIMKFRRYFLLNDNVEPSKEMLLLSYKIDNCENEKKLPQEG